jgi:hypothetical protein
MQATMMINIMNEDINRHRGRPVLMDSPTFLEIGGASWAAENLEDKHKVSQFVLFL